MADPSTAMISPGPNASALPAAASAARYRSACHPSNHDEFAAWGSTAVLRQTLRAVRAWGRLAASRFEIHWLQCDGHP